MLLRSPIDFQQLNVFKSFYKKHQDMLLQMRAVRKDGLEPTTELVALWEQSMMEMDKVHRERLFILTIAFEKGWRIASEVAFIKKGLWDTLHF